MNSVNSCKERNGDFGQGLKEKVPTASALHLGSSFKGASYSVCNTQNHKTEKCLSEQRLYSDPMWYQKNVNWSALKGDQHQHGDMNSIKMSTVN